jgi:hypothetical protein
MRRARGSTATKILGFLAFLAGLAFYVCWPAYSGYEIKSSLDTHDAARLAAKVDFPSVRQSLRPAVTTKVEKVLGETLRNAGPARATLTEDLKARLVPRVVDAVLGSLVTPEMLIRVHEQGGNLKQAIDSIVAERALTADGLGGLISGLQVGEGVQAGDNVDAGSLGSLKEIAGKLGVDPNAALGGLLGKQDDAPPPPPTPVELKMPAPKYGFGNIKHFGVSGPLTVAVGVARDPSARKPDLTAEMGFVGGDWKLTGLVPGS